MNKSGQSKSRAVSTSRRQRSSQRRQRRQLFAEALEDRRLLAANPFQNPTDPDDVDADGVVTTMDLVYLLSDIQINGSRELAMPQSLSSGEGEGESGSASVYLDVTADGYVTTEDLLQVLNRLVAESQGPQVRSDIRVSSNSVNVGGTVRVDVFAQDIRTPGDPDFPNVVDNDDLGLFQAYYDFSFPANVSVVPNALDDAGTPVTFLHGPDFRFLTSGNNPVFPLIEPGNVSNGTPTKINDLGGGITSFLPGQPRSAQGPGEFALVSYVLRVDSTGLTANNDTGLNVDETAVDAQLDVLANDSVIDSFQIDRSETDGVGRNVLTFFADQSDPASRRVPANEILGTEPTVTLNGVALSGLAVVSVTAGQATVGNNGVRDVILFSPQGATGNVEIEYTVGDGAGGIATATATVSIGPVNDAPTITNPASASVNEEQLLTFSGANAITVNDVDAGSGDIRVELGVSSGVLTLSTTTGLTFINGTANGQAAVDVEGTLAEIQAALTNLTYQGNLDFNGADTLTIDVDDLGNTGDGGPQQDSASFVITVNPVNDAPITTAPGAYTAIAGEANLFSGGNAITVSDVDVAETPGGTLRMTLTVATGEAPGPGILTVPGGTSIVGGANNSASVTIEGTIAQVTAALNGLSYTPPANLFGAATLTIGTTDQGNTGTPGPLTDNDVINITVVPPVLPFAIPETFNFVEDSTGSDSVNVMDVLGNDRAEVGSDPILISFTQPAANATVALTSTSSLNTTDALLTITPDPDFEGTVTFTYTINETPNQGGADSIATVTVNFAGLNDAPVAVNDDQPNALLTTDEGAQLVIQGATLTGNDSPGPGEGPTDAVPQTLTVISATANVGSVAVVNNVLTYTPPQFFNDNLGTATITYTVQDNGKDQGVNNFLTATAVATLSITPVNDAPVGTPDLETVVEDNDLILSAAALIGDDTPGGGADENTQILTMTGIDSVSAQGGSIVRVGDVITYTPPLDFNGTDTFNYVVTDDGTPNKSATVQVSVNVTPDNDDPVANPDTVDAIKNVTKLIDVADLLANDNPGGGVAEQGQNIFITGVSANSTAGGASVTLSGTTITYTPASGADFSGIDTFTYTLEDDAGGSATGTVTVDVADFVPSFFSGFVYADTNNDGDIQDVENMLGGITIFLTGTGVNGPVNTSTTTAADGSYSFGTDAIPLTPGSYTITQGAVPFFLDGKDTPGNGATANGNDSFNFTVGPLGGVNSVMNNFGERGLNPGYFSLTELAARRPTAGALIAVEDSGGTAWASMFGFTGIEELTATVSQDRSTVTVVARSSSGTITRAFNVDTDNRVRLIGNENMPGAVIRLDGTAQELGLLASAEAESSEGEGEGEGGSDQWERDIELLAQRESNRVQSAVDDYFSMLG